MDVGCVAFVKCCHAAKSLINFFAQKKKVIFIPICYSNIQSDHCRALQQQFIQIPQFIIENSIWILLKTTIFFSIRFHLRTFLGSRQFSFLDSHVCQVGKENQMIIGIPN